MERGGGGGGAGGGAGGGEVMGGLYPMSITETFSAYCVNTGRKTLADHSIMIDDFEGFRVGDWYRS